MACDMKNVRLNINIHAMWQVSNTKRIYSHGQQTFRPSYTEMPFDLHFDLMPMSKGTFSYFLVSLCFSCLATALVLTSLLMVLQLSVEVRTARFTAITTRLENNFELFRLIWMWLWMFHFILYCHLHSLVVLGMEVYKCGNEKKVFIVFVCPLMPFGFSALHSWQIH